MHLVNPRHVIPSETPFSSAYIRKTECMLKTRGQSTPLQVRFNCTLRDGTVIYDTHPDDVYAPYIVYAAINIGLTELMVEVIPVSIPFSPKRFMNAMMSWSSMKTINQ